MLPLLTACVLLELERADTQATQMLRANSITSRILLWITRLTGGKKYIVNTLTTPLRRCLIPGAVNDGDDTHTQTQTNNGKNVININIKNASVKSSSSEASEAAAAERPLSEQEKIEVKVKDIIKDSATTSTTSTTTTSSSSATSAAKSTGSDQKHNNDTINELKRDALERATKLAQLYELDVEVNPRFLAKRKLTPTQIKATLEVNRKNLMFVSQVLLDCILSSRSKSPPSFCTICNIISTLLEKRHKSPLMVHSTISGFVFLRFWCPVITLPDKFDLVDRSAMSKTARRKMILVAKMVQVCVYICVCVCVCVCVYENLTSTHTHIHTYTQALANIVEEVRFKEEYMRPLKPFFVTNLPRVKKFLNSLSLTLKPIPRADVEVDERSYIKHAQYIESRQQLVT